MVVCSADDYHVCPDGTYAFNPKNAGAAHGLCLRKFISALLSGNDVDVVVDNTNTSTYELAPYMAMAAAYGVGATIYLRVLEYANCILFMTTSMGETVDDAIASRCIVKLSYKIPDAESQKRIWRVLADMNGIELVDAEISKIVKRHGDLTGRDIKNMLKLATIEQLK